MVSLIATILNEKDNLANWLENIYNQSVTPDEVIIVDGGSNDGTWEWLQNNAVNFSNLKIFQYKSNIAAGRNFAIKQASGDIIVATDSGCSYDREWLRKLTEPLTFGKAKFAATGFGPWLNSTDKLLAYLIASSTTPMSDEFKNDWLPSSRSVVFEKELWQNVGGYPEWIPICEDIIFDLKIKKAGEKTVYIRESMVFWRPRTTLGAYFKQLFRYTKSDGHGKLWLGRQLIRYSVYLLVLVLLILSIKINPVFILILLLGLLVYIKKFWSRWWVFSKPLGLGKKIVGTVLLPFVVAFGDIAKMCGWPVGVYERWVEKIKFEKY